MGNKNGRTGVDEQRRTEQWNSIRGKAHRNTRGDPAQTGMLHRLQGGGCETHSLRELHGTGGIEISENEFHASWGSERNRHLTGTQKPDFRVGPFKKGAKITAALKEKGHD